MLPHGVTRPHWFNSLCSLAACVCVVSIQRLLAAVEELSVCPRRSKSLQCTLAIKEKKNQLLRLYLLITLYVFSIGVSSNFDPGIVKSLHPLWSETKLFIHSLTSMVPLLKFGNGWVISYHTLNGCHYLSMLGLKLIHASKRDLRCCDYALKTGRIVCWYFQVVALFWFLYVNVIKPGVHFSCVRNNSFWICRSQKTSQFHITRSK